MPGALSSRNPSSSSAFASSLVVLSAISGIVGSSTVHAPTLYALSGLSQGSSPSLNGEPGLDSLAENGAATNAAKGGLYGLYGLGDGASGPTLPSSESSLGNPPAVKEAAGDPELFYGSYGLQDSNPFVAHPQPPLAARGATFLLYGLQAGDGVSWGLPDGPLTPSLTTLAPAPSLPPASDVGEGGAALLYGLQDDDGGGGSAEDEPRGSLVMLPSLLYGLYGLHGPGEELSGLQSQEGVVGDGDGGVSDGQSEVYGASITRRAGGHPIFLEDEWSRKSLGHWATSRRGWEDDDEEDEGSSGSSSGRWFFPREREEEEGTHKSVADVLRGVDFFPQESESAQSYRGAKAMGDRRSSDEAEGRGDDKRSFSSSDDRMSEEVPPPPIRAGYGSSAEGDTEDSPVENTAERATREQKLLKWLLEAETAAAAWKEPKEGEGAEHAEAGSKEGGGEGGELPDAMPTRLEVPPLDGRVADCQRDAHGSCCPHPWQLDASQSCCFDQAGVDECGVCGGEAATCKLQASIQVAIKGNRDRSAEVAGVRSLILSATLSLDVLPQSLVLDAWEEAVDPERRLLVEVPERQGRGAEWGGSASEESARRSLLQGGGSEMLGAEDGWRRVNVQFSIIPHEDTVMQVPAVEVTSVLLRASARRNARLEVNGVALALTGVAMVKRAGVCGNSVCEIGEADVPSGGQTGTCPEDCTSGDPEAPPSLLAVPLSEFPPPSGGNLSDASGRNATGQSPPLSAAEPAEGTYSTAFWESLGAWPAEGLVAVPAEVPPILDQTARGSAALNIRQASGGEADRDAGGEQCILARDGSCCPKPGSLDANFDCCGGAVDECGVCWGEGSTCLVVLPVTLRLPQALQAPARAAVGSFQGPSAAFVASLSVSVGAVLERCGVRSRNVTARVLEVSGGPLTSLDGVLESNGGRRLAGADKDGGSNEEGSRAAAEGPEASGLPLDKVYQPALLNTLQQQLQHKPQAAKLPQRNPQQEPQASIRVKAAVSLLPARSPGAETFPGMREVEAAFRLAASTGRAYEGVGVVDSGVARREGVCGNGVCERGEAKDPRGPLPASCPGDCLAALIISCGGPGDSVDGNGTCAAPCPVAKPGGDPGTAGKACGGRGACNDETGECDCSIQFAGPDCSKCNSVAGFTRDPDGRGCIRLHDGPVATPKERGTERRSAKVLRITLVATALAAMGLLVFAGAAWGFQRRASLGPARRWGGAGTSTPPATPAMMNESRKPWTLRVNGDGSREGPAGPSVVRPEVDGGTLKGCVGRATAREGFGERRRVWQAEEDSGGGKGGGQGFCLPQPTGRAGELAGRARSSVAKAMSLFSLPTPLAPSKDTSLDDNSRMTKL